MEPLRNAHCVYYLIMHVNHILHYVVHKETHLMALCKLKNSNNIHQLVESA